MASLSNTIVLPLAMSAACAEARRWMGATAPNPPVGASALSATGEILAAAAHHKAGDLHAETALIELCRAKNILDQVHTLCVTLEPCNHQGQQPPCTEAIIKSGIKHIAVGMRDPNPQVRGGGVERLREAGIKVVTGVQEDECAQLIHAFAQSVKTSLPWVTIKRAVDENNSMIPPPGKKTFASKHALSFAHLLRKKSDAILTGSGTILADNPLFTVRHMQDYPGKRRWLAILDRRCRVKPDYIKAASERGLDAVIYQDVRAALEDLSSKGARDVLVEAGPSLSQAMLDSPFWNLSVTIRHNNVVPGSDDEVDSVFNPFVAPPFDVVHFNWDWLLPS